MGGVRRCTPASAVSLPPSTGARWFRASLGACEGRAPALEEPIGVRVGLNVLPEVPAGASIARDRIWALQGSRAVAVAIDRNDEQVAVWAATTVAWALSGRGEIERAGRLLGATLAQLERVGVFRQRTDRNCEHAVREALRHLDQATVAILLAEGADMPLGDALADARAAFGDASRGQWLAPEHTTLHQHGRSAVWPKRRRLPAHVLGVPLAEQRTAR